MALFEKSLAKTFVKGKNKSEVFCTSLFYLRLCRNATAGANGFCAEIAVLRPEGVRGYVERAKTAIVNKKTEKIKEIRENFILIIH